jgi:hypothetical protein
VAAHDEPRLLAEGAGDHVEEGLVRQGADRAVHAPGHVDRALGVALGELALGAHVQVRVTLMQ